MAKTLAPAKQETSSSPSGDSIARCREAESFRPGKYRLAEVAGTLGTWNAIVADVKPPGCGLFGCDEKIKVGDKWKCVACGKITDY